MKKKISVELEKKLNAIPDAKRGRATIWTLEQDSALLLYCPTKGVRAVAEILGENTSTCRARYKYLLGRVSS